MIHTTYFGGVGSVAHPADEDRVFGVVRHPKDFVERVVDRNIPVLAPPEDLLSAFKTVESAADVDDVDKPAAVAWRSVNFQLRYHEHLEENSGARIVIKNLRQRAREGDIWLVCWEKDPRYCHRRLLADEIAAGIEREVEVKHHPTPDEMAAQDPEPTDSTSTLAQFAGESE